MGSLRDGDGGERPPPDDGDLPEFPPEWGVVVIPDDLTELDRETAALQRERRRQTRRAKWRRRLGLPAAHRKTDNSSPVGVPLLIMSIAIIAALTSLFAITLSSRTTRSQQPPTAPAATPQESLQMIDLALTDAKFESVRLQDHLPAAILLLDGCACDQLIRETVAAAPPGVTVIAVDREPPLLPVGLNVITLADPEQALLATYADGADRGAQLAGVPTVVLVDGDGTVTKVVNPANRLVDFKNQLTDLS